MKHYAILIDGGFARRKLGGARVSPAVADDFQKLIHTIANQPTLQGCALYRVYDYDAMPLLSAHDKLLGGGKVEFAKQPVAKRVQALFERLYKLPFVALRLAH